MTRHVIVLSAHNIALGLVRSLGRAGIPTVVISYQKSDMAQASRYVKEAFSAPHPEELQQQFVEVVMDVAHRYPGSIIMPADDATLVAASKHKEQLEACSTVACPDWDVVERLIDKKYTYELAEEIGVPAPRTMVPQTPEDARTYAARALYPCLVKPCQSHLYYERFKKKLVKVNNADELMAAYSEAAEAGMEVMLQEFIPGDDSTGVNFNSYCENGRTLVEFTAEKVRISPPESGVPAVVISKKLPEITPAARKMLEALQLSGYSCMEFKKDARDGVYKLMEVNPRHNRSLLLAVKCGINFPVIEYNHRLGREIPSPPSFRTGVYWIDGFKDMVAGRPYRKAGKLSFGSFIKPYLRPHIGATFSLTDPLPFLKRCRDMAGMAVQALFKQKKTQTPSLRLEIPEADGCTENHESQDVVEPVLTGKHGS